MHFARLANTLLKTKKVHETNTNYAHECVAQPVGLDEVLTAVAQVGGGG